MLHVNPAMASRSRRPKRDTRANRAAHGDQRRCAQRSDSDPGRDRRLRSVSDPPGFEEQGDCSFRNGIGFGRIGSPSGWLFDAGAVDVLKSKQLQLMTTC